MSAAFTPGPWDADMDSVNIHVGGEQIASAWVPRHRPNPIPEREANARLIAAAPDLYEALIDWRNAYLCPNSDIEESATRLLEATDAALAKARGES